MAAAQICRHMQMSQNLQLKYCLSIFLLCSALFLSSIVYYNYVGLSRLPAAPIDKNPPLLI